MTKIHLDTDLGGDIDDLCALAMLLNWPDVEIIAITTVAEENGRRTGYTKYALRLAGREDIPVAAGADVASGSFRDVPGYPPDDEMWPEPVRYQPNPVDDALTLLRSSVEQEAILIGIGPCTNLALLDRKYPGILQAARIFLMGGYVSPPREDYPQWGCDMDYNFQLDIASARHVLEHSQPTLVPLNVTVETALRRAHLAGLRAAAPLGALVARQAVAFARMWKNDDTYGKTCRGLPADIINFLHDPLACAAALGWDGVQIDELPLTFAVEDGWLCGRVDERGRPTNIATAIDGNRFNEFWFHTVCSAQGGDHGNVRDAQHHNGRRGEDTQASARAHQGGQ